MPDLLRLEPAIQKPPGAQNEAAAISALTDFDDGLNHNVGIVGVPSDLRKKLKQKAAARGLRLHSYILQVFSESTPIQLTTGELGTTLPTVSDQRTHQITVNNVPNLIWKRVRQNALLSNLRFRAYLHQLIKQCTASTSPESVTNDSTQANEAGSHDQVS